MKTKFKKLAVGLLLVSAVGSANATVYRWSFEDLSSSGTFAFLDFDTASSNFRLFDNTSNGYLTGNVGINGISFSFLNGFDVTGPAVTFQTVWDNTTIGSLTSTDAAGGYTRGFKTATNAPADEIQNGESTSFNFGAIDFSNIAGVAVRLNANDANNSNSGVWAFQTASALAVSEVETSAMMVLGLGLLGFAAKRRRKV